MAAVHKAALALDAMAVAVRAADVAVVAAQDKAEAALVEAWERMDVAR